MTKKMILLFSHSLTRNQEEDAKKTFNVDTFINLPVDLQKKWSNIPPDLADISAYLSDIRVWLKKMTSPGDIILIQGDFGATYNLVNWAFQNKMIPVYSTTKRIHKENILNDGTVESVKSFQHLKFRQYQN